jgi:hypothetical protein
MRNISLLFSGEVDGEHYDALLPDEENEKWVFLSKVVL